MEGPNFSCYSCQRSLFRVGVKILSKEEISKLLQGFKESYLKDMKLMGYIFFTQLILCHNCFQMVKKQKVPSNHVTNGLNLDDVPNELKRLSELEHQLIQPNLIFMKIKRLPKTGMRATHDRIISAQWA